MATAAGIDACRGGWVMALIAAEPGGGSDVVVASNVGDLLDRCRRSRVAAVGIDIPIGFAPEGNREAEGLARARLGRRSSTLFPSPAHRVLAIDDWAEALAVNRRIAGKGMSKQSFHLLAGSREVRAALAPTEQPWCSEVHPETSFTEMNNGRPLVSKYTDEGRKQRRELIASLVAADAPAAIDSAGAPTVDALDAYAAAWSASRLARGEADVLGAGSDPDGYSLTIVV